MADKRRQSIQRVSKLDAFIVAFTDGDGSEQVRICFRPQGTNDVYMLNERISGQNVAVSANPWFDREFKHVVDGQEEALPA